MPGNPHFSFDRSVLLTFRYLLTKKKRTKAESWKGKCVFPPLAVKSVDHRGHLELAKKGIWIISSVKRLSTVITHLTDPFKLIEFHDIVFLPGILGARRFLREDTRSGEKRREKEKVKKPLVADPASWLEKPYVYSDWLLLADRCVVIGCLLIESRDVNWHLS